MSLSSFQLGLIRSVLLPHVQAEVTNKAWLNKDEELQAYYWARESQGISLKAKLASSLMIFVVSLEKHAIEGSGSGDVAESAKLLLLGLKDFSKLVGDQERKEFELVLSECSISPPPLPVNDQPKEHILYWANIQKQNPNATASEVLKIIEKSIKDDSSNAYIEATKHFELYQNALRLKGKGSSPAPATIADWHTQANKTWRR